MKICPACQRENEDDTDFCVYCGEYLRWDPTTVQPVVRPPVAPGAPGSPAAGRPVPPPPPGRGPADAVSITLRSLTEDVDPREGVRLSAEPGSTATLVASIRNQSGIVDNYDLRVEGVPDGWWTITPATAYLVPYGAPSGRYEQDAQVHLHPPRSAGAEARDWPIRVVAGSRATSTDAGSATARLTVRPYQEVETELRPERGSGRARAKFAFAVRNLANAPIELEFSAVDSEDKCKFAFKQKRGIAQPGKRTGSQLIAKPKKTLWVGRPVDHPFRIEAREPGNEDTVITRPAVYRQRAWVAWWVPIALVAALALGVAGYELFKKAPTIPTPNLKGHNASVVQKVLEHVGLLLSTAPAQTEQVAKSEVGKVVGQKPDKGFPLHHGSVVSIIVGVAATKGTVPDVCNMPFSVVAKALKAQRLTLGPVQPTATPGAKTLAKGCSQPAANASVQQGSPVSVFLQSSGGGSVPSTAGQPAAAAATALQSAGFKTITIPVLATDPTRVGKIVAQQPGSGANLAKGSTIYLYEGEIPSLAYDNGNAIQIAWYANGATPSPVTITTPTGSSEPSWSADGTELVFSVRATGALGSVDLVPATQGATASPVLTSTTQDYHRPVFAPLAGSSVIAFTAWNAPSDSQSSLCFLDLSQQPLPQPSCTAPVNYLLDRPTWSPDGTSVAVVAESPGTAPTPAGVIVYSSLTPASTNESDWVPQSSAPVLAPGGGADPTFLAFAPSTTTALLGYTSFLAIFTTPAATIGSPTPTKVYAAPAGSQPPAFAWRADNGLAVGGQACAGATAPPIMLVSATGTATPANVSGCNPSLQPLPLPPSN